MKKILLSIGTIAALTALSQESNAQVFKVRYESLADTMKTTGTEDAQSPTTDVVLYTHLDAEAGIDSFTYTWQIKEFVIPTTWKMVGFCDNVICHTPTTPMFQAPNFAESPESAYVTPNTGVGTNPSSKLYPWINASKNTAGKGVAVLKMDIKTKDVKVSTGTPPTQTAELLYIVEKTTDALSVAKISIDDQRLVVYPNPASGVVTIYADASLKATQVVVTDLMGRTINNVKLDSSKTIHTLDIANLNAGLYNLTVVDASGAVLNTKKLSVL